MLSLLNTYEDDLRTSLKRDRLGTTFKRLQVSLDSFHHGTSLGLRQLPVSREANHHDRWRAHLPSSSPPPPTARARRGEIDSLPQFRGDTLSPRYIKPPTTQELIDTESAAVNYIVSDTLFSARNESSREYTHPFVDPMTGVRLRETYWLAAARKANIVLVGQGPLSAPGPTYAGNWTFLRHVPDYVDKSRIITDKNRNHDDEAHMHTTIPRSPDILNAAVHLTISRFLPNTFQLLRSFDQEGIRTSKRKRLIWPSSWYHLPGRGVARTLLLRLCGGSRIRNWMQWAFPHQHSMRTPVERVLTLQLSAFINADLTGKSSLEDPWTLLFNAQGKHMEKQLRVVSN
ncbi:hypothetical protein JVU11DRAFT_7286 [Chiua virens]|nr:hypothetical protein JVU11DRAFT_7286 [Chiua virens]